MQAWGAKLAPDLLALDLPESHLPGPDLLAMAVVQDFAPRLAGTGSRS